ncbi:hypothetical protein fugu_002396 [Takifugu bimaculatus]|uniref:Hemopexin n=1 Tax=Takifugu bimaculatus TaxID=433685 RepID=A0A4Z2BSD3_9TELE|nr:hypothetical protein fugu_002396 [Takifugu bimaculatus]
MDLFSKTLLLCLLLILTDAAPAPQDAAEKDNISEVKEEDSGPALPDRCAGIEFDAITPDEKGKTLFFKGAYMWKDFHGPAQLVSESFKEIDDIPNAGHISAAFRMHNKANPDDHDRIYLFLEDKVFSYYEQVLEEGYPKHINEEFPGVPTHLDAAVECPKGECMADSVLFFKGQDVHVYDLSTKTVKTKTWSHLPACTSAFRWLEHYYCFHGHNFTRFNPISGEVNGTYPKDARHYFMRCPNFGHGGGYNIPKCSEVKIDAITVDDAGRMYAFAGPIYMRLDTRRDGFHAFPITRMWKEVVGKVDAVFSYGDKMYLIKGKQVYIYKSGAHYTLVEGYPKTLEEELGVEGPVDAAFVCPGQHTVHIIQGERFLDVSLTATPRVVARNLPFVLSDIDAAYCDANGVKLFSGSKYYQYPSATILALSKIAALAEPITSEMLGCRD